jgi:ribonuclease E
MSNVAQLRALAKELNIKGYSTAKKADLINLLEVHGGKTMPADESHKAHEPVKAADPVKTEAPVKAETPVAKPKRVKAAAPTAKPATPSTPLSAESRKARGASAWSEFLKAYKAEHSCSLKEAMTKKDEYAAYKAKQN